MGGAGLALALELLPMLKEEVQLLIIDQDLNKGYDRTWCFWSEQMPYPVGDTPSWSDMEFADANGSVSRPLSPLKYFYLASPAFYDYALKQLKQSPFIQFLEARIHNLQVESNTGIVFTSEGIYKASGYVFDARGQFSSKERSSYALHQQFYGEIVEVNQALFNPEQIRLMDFDMDQEGDIRFGYVLPYTETKALVEVTRFSKELDSKESFKAQFKDYLQKLGIDAYKQEHTEFASIPMEIRQMDRLSQLPIIPIGVAGGMVKPTTGYAFQNFVKDAKHLAQQLKENGAITQASMPVSGRFAWYDKLLMHILVQTPQNGSRIFSRLFRNNPFTRILRFLNGETSIFEEIKLFATLPIGLFLKAVWETSKKTKPFSVEPSTKGLTLNQKVSR